MTLRTRELKAWLALRHPDETFFTGPDLPKFPGRMVVLTPAPGAGLDAEFVLDRPGFQVHVVGPQTRDGRVNDAAGQAEDLIYGVEKTLLTALWPQAVGDHRVQAVQRFGAGPSPLSPDTAGRCHFIATYLFLCVSGYVQQTDTIQL